MIVSIHQPQYLPWVPYFAKLDKSDVFVLLDSVDFQKNGLQNRNRIKTSNGPQWLTVPVQQALGQKICDVSISGSVDWRKKHWQTITQSYGKTPYFSAYCTELEEVYCREWTRLADLDSCLISMIARWFGVKCDFVRSSELRAGGKGSALILNVCLELGATNYLSGVGARAYLDEAAFSQAGIGVVFAEPQLPREYPQAHPHLGFLADLSAMDMLFSCGDEWRRYLPEAM